MKDGFRFRWMMAACCMLDIVLLFWILNPFSGRMKNLRWFAEVADSASGAAGKPTPLGVAAVRALLQHHP